MRIPTLITAFAVLALTACGGGDASTQPTATETGAPPENGSAPAAGEQEKGTSVEVHGDGLQVESKAADVKVSTDSLKIQLK